MTSPHFDFLPVEVIQNIFVLSLPENNLAFSYPKERYVVQPIISQVSSRWRSIALDTPQLWDNIVVSVNDNRWQAEAALRLASLWFHRARRSLITLMVWTDLPRHNPHIQELYRLISSHRLKRLTGSLELCSLLLHHKSYEESISFLDSLCLNIPYDFSVDFSQAGQSPDSDNYCQLPSLRYLHIDFHWIDLPWRTTLPMIPWRQLSSLSLHSISKFSTVIEIMCECKALVECELFIISHLNDGFVSRSTTLPHLRNIKISSLSPISESIDILSTFEVPDLTSIVLVCDGGSYIPSGTLLSSQLDRRPFQKLQEFTFSDPYHMIHVKSFLYHMPTLRSLTLSGSVSLDCDTAEKISTGHLGRYMVTISFSACRTVKRVLDMVEKRQEIAEYGSGQNMTPFRYVWLTCPTPWCDKYKERVEHLERRHNVQVVLDPVMAEVDSEEEGRRRVL